MDKQIETISQIKSTVIDLGLKFGPRVFTAMVIMTLGYFVARWAGGVFHRWISRLDLEPPVRTLLVRLLRLFVLALFLLLSLQNLGVELLPLIAGLGVAGAGLALAMQGVLGNLVAGLTIIFTRPFRVGQYVAMLDVEGQVEAIDLFSTKLSHTDLSRVVVPNRKIVGEILHNYGSVRQLDLAVSVAYDADLSRVVSVVGETLRQNPRVLQDPAPVVGVSTLADSWIDVAVKPWVKVSDYVPAGAEIYQAIIARFRQEQIEMPFPQQEVRLLGGAAA
jgi:small conductance mechanosensitive channel